MKKVIIVLAIVIAAGVIAGCKKKKRGDDAPIKSTACEILTFKVDSKAWTITGTNIIGTYSKDEVSAAGETTPLTPVITVSAGATVSPASGVASTTFFSTGVNYTVTAEDGKTTKTYTAQAKRP